MGKTYCEYQQTGTLKHDQLAKGFALGETYKITGEARPQFHRYIVAGQHFIESIRVISETPLLVNHFSPRMDRSEDPLCSIRVKKYEVADIGYYDIHSLESAGDVTEFEVQFSIPLWVAAFEPSRGSILDIRELWHRDLQLRLARNMADLDALYAEDDPKQELFGRQVAPVDGPM